MSGGEPARLELYQRLVTVLGPDHARTLMANLPPGGWGEIATKRDVAQVRSELRSELETTKQEILATVLREINAQTRLLFFAMIGAVFTAASLAFAAVHLG